MRSFTRVPLLSGILGLVAIGCGEGAPAPAALEDALLEPVGHIAHEAIGESSGLAFLAGAYWTHNDSGDSPRLFRSATPDFAAAEVLPVPGADAVDWEEIAVLDDDLLVCDLGDNDRIRDDLAMYRVAPVVPDTAGEAALTLRATYPVAYPDGRHDAEGVAVVGGKVHVITKDRGEGTLVFRFDELVDGGVNTPTFVGSLDLGHKETVTAADFDATSGMLVLLTYTQIAAYPAARLEGKPQHSTWIGARQSEALCVRGDDLVFTNEQRDVFEVKDFREWRYRSLWPQRGTTSIGSGEPTPLPLLGGAEGESATWSLGESSIDVSVRLTAPQETEATDPATGNVGTGVLLTFGRVAKRHISGDESVLALVAQGPDPKFGGLYLLGFTDKGVEMEDASSPAAVAVHSVKRADGFVTLSAKIPRELVFAGPMPKDFRFAAFSVGFDGPPKALFGVPDFYALYKPYLWGDVNVSE